VVAGEPAEADLPGEPLHTLLHALTIFRLRACARGVERLVACAQPGQLAAHEAEEEVPRAAAEEEYVPHGFPRAGRARRGQELAQSGLARRDAGAYPHDSEP